MEQIKTEQIKVKRWRKMDILIIVVVALFIILVFALGHYESRAEDNACKKIGFNNYYGGNSGFEYCRDVQDNLHYINMDCDFTGLYCTAKNITVGNVEVASK